MQSTGRPVKQNEHTRSVCHEARVWPETVRRRQSASAIDLLYRYYRPAIDWFDRTSRDCNRCLLVCCGHRLRDARRLVSKLGWPNSWISLRSAAQKAAFISSRFSSQGGGKKELSTECFPRVPQAFKYFSVTMATSPNDQWTLFSALRATHTAFQKVGGLFYVPRCKEPERRQRLTLKLNAS
ncbi:hypothetical protein CEXT_77691 [Caerostris extrusa]|uniref:Uncharacterized protein n=1 Tax=Caerostris extrusa TaxID=172846 RepID=A0AAV4U5M3_CAEEX|nr:hypothetical protein CEXT_77691 [Caerostris extrusa]